MQLKSITFKTKGMTKDNAESASGNDLAFENMNLRLTASDDNTLLAWTNERGTKDLNVSLNGNALGYCLMDDYAIVFTHSETCDYIYKLYKENDEIKIHALVSTDLGFDLEYPIEALGIYENQNSIKVYWTDNKNQPRVLNIAKALKDSGYYNDNPRMLDFVPALEFNESLTVEKNELSDGTFAPGVIQYAFTYFNVYGQETGIIDVSSLYYTSYSDRGASPDEMTHHCFDISISNVDTAFDYIRLYSIHRTSLDAIPTVKKISDFTTEDIRNTHVFKYTDDGESGETVDPTILRFIGGKHITAGTLEQKDEVLFLGNIAQVGDLVSDEIKSTARNTDVSFIVDSEKTIVDPNPTGIYPYKNHLNQSSNVITTFKSGEKYRFGFQLQKETGEWSEPIYIDDVENTKTPYHSSIEDTDTKLISAQASIAVEKLEGYKRIRPLIVYPSIADRQVVCQGVLNPTVFNPKDRKHNAPFSQASWFFRPNLVRQTWGANNISLDEWFAPAVGEDGTPEVKTFHFIDKSKFAILTNTCRDKASAKAAIGKTLLVTFLNFDDKPIVYYTFKIEGYRYYPMEQGGSNEWLTLFIASTETQDITRYRLAQSDGAVESVVTISADDFINDYSTYKASQGTDRLVKMAGQVCSYVDVYTPEDSRVVSYPNPHGLGASFLVDAIQDCTIRTGEQDGVIYGTTNSLEPEDNQELVFYTHPDSNVGQDTITILGHLILSNYLTKTDKEFIIRGKQHVVKTDDSGTEKVEDIYATVEGSPLEFRHYHPLPSSLSGSCEIQSCTTRPDILKAFSEFKESTVSSSVTVDATKNFDKYSDTYYIDQSIVTFNSPDLEFDESLRYVNPENLSLRIVGYIPITGTIADIGIKTLTPPMNYRVGSSMVSSQAIGFYKEIVGESNINKSGDLGLVSAPFWMDEVFSADDKYDSYNRGKNTTWAFPIYPWHRSGSLNNQTATSESASDSTDNSYRNSRLSNKRMSNLRFSYATVFDDIEWEVSPKSFAVVDSNEVTTTRIIDDEDNARNYFGNVDKLLIHPVGDDIKKDGNQLGYKLTYAGHTGGGASLHKLFCNAYKYLDTTGSDNAISLVSDTYGTDPIKMKYKSTIHAVLSLAKPLPIASKMSSVAGSYYKFWSVNSNKDRYYTCDGKDIDSEFGYLWLAELVNTPANPFGGTNEYAIQNNRWTIGGEAVNIPDSGNVTIKWTEGDTYYQRYDCLKTYPFTSEDENSIIDILSFMCETRINLDGRYDKNRGLPSNIYITPDIFNKMNKVYSQRNDFFDYRILDNDLYDYENYPSSITWTKKKIRGEKIDTWTNLTLASTLDFDGDKGAINKLIKYNDTLIAFQDRGISQIMYNNNVQLATTSGTPIEIANSGRVTGKQYITESIGCANKASICQTPNGVYFQDFNTRSFYLFNNSLTNITDSFGFHSWMQKNFLNKKWNPKTFEGYTTLYDKLNGDVLFTSRDKCLAYSERVSQFTSFYGYENTPYLIPIKDTSIWLKPVEDNTALYEHNTGDYNKFFGEYKPFYTEVIAAPDFMNDKIFTNIEFRADSFDSEDKLVQDTYDKIYVHTEYQKGESSMIKPVGAGLGKHPSLQRKFRIWRADIPRDEGDARGLNRIRNMWAYLKIAKETENTLKTVLHDLTIMYYE